MRRHEVCGVVMVTTVLSALLGGVGCQPTSEATRHDITAAQLQQMLDGGDPLVLLDVRRADEFAAGHIAGALNRPVEDVEAWWSALDPEARTVNICKAGVRSQQAADTLIGKGFTDVYNVLGGMDGWPGETVTGAE